MALGLHFDGAAQILRVDVDAGERILPTRRTCVSMISPYSMGKASSDAANSSRGNTSGVAAPARCHCGANNARALRSSIVSELTSARLCVPSATGASKRNHGLEAGAEDPLQVGNDAVEAAVGRRFHGP